MMNRLNLWALRAMQKLQDWKEDEQGMEIIQVLVLLAIGLGLVAIFIGFGNQITSAVTEKVGEFMDTFA